MVAEASLVRWSRGIQSHRSRWAPAWDNMRVDMIGQIRKRRGLYPRPPSYEEFFEKE